jgi:outer membrane protein assembly factor BamB
MSEERFLSELADYMNKRYEVKLRTASKEEFTFCRYTGNPPTVRAVDGRRRRLRWKIYACMEFPRIEGYLSGKIIVSSGYVLQDVFLDNDPLNYGTADKEKEKIIRMLRNRWSREKLKSKNPSIIGEFIYGKRVAETVSREKGVKVRYSFPRAFPFSTFFYSGFNSKRMSFDDKMRTIKILLDAIDMAFEEAWEFNKLYDFFTAHGYRERKKYFRSAREGESEYYIPRHGAIRIMETSKAEYYLGLRDGRLLAFKRGEGIKWMFVAREAIQPTAPILLDTMPLIPGEDGTIYFFSSDKSSISHYFYALNPDGTLKWEFKIENKNTTSIKTPVFSNDTIYVAFYEMVFNESIIQALTRNGDLKWSFRLEGRIETSPTIGYDGTLYFTCSDSHLYALGIDGNLKWKFKAEGRIVISPVIIDADGTIYLQTIEHLPGLPAVFTDHCKYYLYAINPDGSLKWRREQGKYELTGVE